MVATLIFKTVASDHQSGATASWRPTVAADIAATAPAARRACIAVIRCNAI